MPDDSKTPLEYLADLEVHGIKLGLDNIRRLLDAAGNPHRTYPTIHVAGTNGKGSVAAFLDAMLRAAGYRVGRFTSPHLISVNERFTIDGTPIDSDTLNALISWFRTVAEQMDAPPTFFEMTTAVAFRWFAEHRVDVAVVEVGMGGRLDSTNVVAPLACAITNIGFDHTQYLGNTLEAIAFEKAGIIKPGVPVVLGEMESVPRERILACAAELASPFAVCGRDFRYAVEGPPFAQIFRYESPVLDLPPTPLALAGRHQGMNAAVAVALTERLQTTFPKLDVEAIRTGLASARWPCRLERVLDDPPVIMDVAHNPEGARVVADAVERCIALLAVSSDKDAASMIAALAPITDRFILSQFTGTRATPLERLCEAADGHSYEAFPFLEEAIARGMALATPDRPLLITGSIFTAGEARAILVERYGARPLEF
jgi:dihydrofolate synthase / folylpolyglutamate synthase